MNLLLREVEVGGRRVDVRVSGDRVRAVGVDLDPAGAEVVDGHGGALLPGLHDHHLHLLALAAALESARCGPPDVVDLAGLAVALSAAPTRGGWVRGIGYHESVAGPLDRRVLDRLEPHRPVRLQHRSGGLWMLNSPALDRAAHALDGSADVERDDRGEPNGRLWRYDDRLRAALPDTPPDLAKVGRMLQGYGITGVTDATPDLAASSIALLAEAVRSGILPVEVTLLGGGSHDLGPHLGRGPHKILLRDHDLPTYDALLELVARTHTAGTAVAVHCVSRESLLLTLAVLDEVGSLEGDRIEHAAVVPRGVAGDLARLGLAVVTQPGFLRTRGDDYRRDVSPDDVPCLYPHHSLQASGVRVTASSDAPFGELDPWRTIFDAVERRTATGEVLGAEERVSASGALDGYLSSPLDPGGPARTVVPGAVADLCLLRASLDEVLRDPTADRVRLVVARGELSRTT